MQKLLAIIKYLLTRTIAVLLFSVLGIVALQDFLLLPYFRESLIHRLTGIGKVERELGANTSRVFIKNAQDRTIETFRYQPPAEQRKAGRFAIIFRGNSGALSEYLPIAESLGKLGVVSYLVNYPGMGASKGWPSEESINQDAALVWNYLVRKQEADPAKLIIVGYSFGSAPAAWLSMLHPPLATVLLAPFPRLKLLAKRAPLYRYLTPLLWYTLPIDEYVPELKSSCLVIATADNDQTVPKELSDKVAGLYHGSGGLFLANSATATHENLYSSNEAEINAGLHRCEAGAPAQSAVKSQ